MIMDPASVEDFRLAMVNLNTRERVELTHQLSGVARSFAEEGKPRVVDVFQMIAVLLAEEGDRQKQVIEDCERETDPYDPDPDRAGSLAADADDPQTEYRKALESGEWHPGGIGSPVAD